MRNAPASSFLDRQKQVGKGNDNAGPGPVNSFCGCP